MWFMQDELVLFRKMQEGDWSAFNSFFESYSEQLYLYALDTAKPVEIRLFIDGSVVEGFINNEDAFTTRIFPLKENSTLLELFSDGKTTEVAAEVWKLKDVKVKMNF